MLIHVMNADNMIRYMIFLIQNKNHIFLLLGSRKIILCKMAVKHLLETCKYTKEKAT